MIALLCGVILADKFHTRPDVIQSWAGVELTFEIFVFFLLILVVITH